MDTNREVRVLATYVCKQWHTAYGKKCAKASGREQQHEPACRACQLGGEAAGVHRVRPEEHVGRLEVCGARSGAGGYGKPRHHFICMRVGSMKMETEEPRSGVVLGCMPKTLGPRGQTIQVRSSGRRHMNPGRGSRALRKSFNARMRPLRPPHATSTPPKPLQHINPFSLCGAVRRAHRDG